ALKDNPYLFKAVLTGILRVSRESLFSGLNNLKVYSALHPQFSPFFGFTEEEVNQLLNKAGLENKAEDIKHWYNGYQMGGTILYNPWSIVNSIEDGGILKPFWVNTSDNALIKDLLLKSSFKFKDKFETLLHGLSLEQIVDENFVFPDLNKNRELAIWSLLLMTGYLTVRAYEDTNRGPLCQLSVPNQEIRNLYQTIIEKWLANGYGLDWYEEFLNHLLNGDMEEFQEGLRHIMEHIVSVHDVGKKEPESFYHGLMIGLTASLAGDKHYETRSNRESGYGRYDYLILARDPNKLSILLEFKQVPLPANKKETEDLQNALNKAAQEALQQIDQQAYLTELKQRCLTNILKIGLAFSGKRFGIAYEQIGENASKSAR
ncbi:MAG: AAA family ATPase, partial [Alphaproteobacteria bacterium]|nr:AAA family ATPase [Alphaproteobacteria bacterium]